MDYLLCNFWTVLEPLLFIVAGVYVHVYQVSVSEGDKDAEFIPSVASTIFVLTVLCACARCRPFWPCSMKSPILIIQFVFDMLATLYTVDLLFRRMWIPILKCLQFVTAKLQEILARLDIDKVNHMMDWINGDGYEYVRIAAALSFLMVMAQSSGVLGNIYDRIEDYLQCKKEEVCAKRRRKGSSRRRRASPTCSMEGCPGEFYQF